MRRAAYFVFNIELGKMLTASLNADLDTVKETVEKSAAQLNSLLSTQGKAIYTHLLQETIRISIERTGTPLQMAIYGDDKELQRFFKDLMSSDEFERQAIEAFSSVLSKETIRTLETQKASAFTYQAAMIEQQKQDAQNLCANLKNAILASDPKEYTLDCNLIANTTSAEVNAAVGDFKTKLLHYRKTHPVHNPYILQTLYDIYHNQDAEPSARDYFFSQKGIGAEQRLLPARWLQHYAQGIGAKQRPLPAAKKRSFCCLNTSFHPFWHRHEDGSLRTGADIRLFVPHLGENRVLDIYATINSDPNDCIAPICCRCVSREKERHELRVISDFASSQSKEQSEIFINTTSSIRPS